MWRRLQWQICGLMVTALVGGGCEQQMRVGATTDGAGDGGGETDVSVRADADGSVDGDGDGWTVGDGTDAAGPDADTSESPEHRAAAAFLGMLCEAAFECPKSEDTRHLQTVRGFASVEECKRVARRQPGAFHDSEAAILGPVLLSDRTEPNLDEKERCLRRFKAALCAQEERHTEADVEACKRFFGPQQMAGGTCVSDLECRGDLSCAFDEESEACTGVCREPASADSERPRQSCGEKTCASGEYCDDRESETCRPKKEEGEVCESIGMCAAPLWCTSRSNGRTTGVCASIGSRERGEGCSIDSLCRVGLTCDSESCVPVELVDEGGDCGVSGATRCKPELGCEPGPLEDNGTCRRPAGLGDPCGGTDGGGCRTGLYCSQNETCEELRPVGAECSYPRQCASADCVDGQCAEFDICSVSN